MAGDIDQLDHRKWSRFEKQDRRLVERWLRSSERLTRAAEKCAALQRWADHVEDLVKGAPTSKVVTLRAVMTEKPDQMPNPAAVMRNREALLQNLGNIFPISEADQNKVIKLQSWYMLALDQVTNFLKASGASGDIVEGFIYLTGAIRELRNGTVADVVQPTPAGRHGPDGVVVWCLRADVAIGLECILRSGKKKTKEKAAKYIAGKYPVFNRLKRKPGASLTTSMLSWRRRINDRDVPEADDVLSHQRSFLSNKGAIIVPRPKCLRLANGSWLRPPNAQLRPCSRTPTMFSALSENLAMFSAPI
jgi:hypothetical protein